MTMFGLTFWIGLLFTISFSTAEKRFLLDSLLTIKTDIEPWQSWGPCSASCGATGTRTRTRACHHVIIIIEISNECLINGTQTESCVGDCPSTLSTNIQTTTTSTQPTTTAATTTTTVLPVIDVWSTWHGVSQCSVSCGGGLRSRSRSCHHHHCAGSSTSIESCNTQPCPVDGGWSSWQNPSQCSVTCGGGVKTRTRTCDHPTPANGGYQCQGRSLQSEHCNTNPCPVNGQWSSWQNPSQCTVTCGGGLRVRTRSCTNPTPANGGQQCVGLFFGSESCNTHPCPVSTTTTTTTPPSTTTKSTTPSATTTTKQQTTTITTQPPTTTTNSVSPSTTTTTLPPPTTTTTPQPTTTTTVTPPTSSTTTRPPQTTTKSTPTTTKKKFITIRAVFK